MFLLMLLLITSPAGQSQALRTYDSLYSLVNTASIPDDTVKAMLLYDLSVAAAKAGIHDHKENGKDYGNAVIYYLEGLELSVKLDYDRGKQRFYQTLAEIYNQRTDLPVLGFELMIDEFSQKRFRELQKFRNRNHYGSLDSYIRASQTLRKLKVDEQPWLLDYWMGLIYFDWLNYTRAIIYFNKAAGSEGIKNDSIMLSDIWQCAGASYFYNGSLDSAIICFNKSLEILKTGKSPLKYGIALSNIGQVYSGKADHSAALTYLKSSLDHFMLSGDSIYIAFVSAETGNTLNKLNLSGPAEAYLSRSMRIAGNLEDKTVLGKSYLYLSNLHTNKRDYDKALQYLNEYNKIRESLLADDVFNYLRFYETTWQNEIGREITKKEGEALKRSETTVELNKTRLYLILMGLIIIMVIFTATYTFRLYRLKQKANIYLSELNRSKEKFLSIISHDIRGPIIGLAELLEPLSRQAGNMSPEELSVHLGKISGLSQNIKLLVDNLLGWTKTQQGLIECDNEVLSMAEVIYHDLSIYRQIAESKGITMITDINEEVTVRGDRNMISLIMRNLLNNAVKFTGEGGTITISSQSGNGDILISVRDTGAGMAKETAARLFDQGSNAAGAGTARKGSGLGLVLCREYAEKCHGKIWADSNGKGTGCTFFLLLIQIQSHEQN